MAKLPKRGNGAEHFFSTRARSWGKLFRPNCRFAGHSTVPFFRKGANMTPRRARERTAWGAHVITYGLFFKSVFWVSCKSADQTKMLQNSCSIRDCTAKKTRWPPLRRTPPYELSLTPRRNKLHTHLRPSCDFNENLSSRFCARGANVVTRRMAGAL